MKKYIVIIIIISLLFFTINLIYYLGPIRNRYSGIRPVDQNNTIWEASEPKIILEINDKFDLTNNRGTISFVENTVEVIFTFDQTNVVRIDDINKITYDTVDWDDTLSIDTSKSLVLFGECDFSKICCKIVVNESNINEIKVGDEIVMYKVNDL